MELTAVEKIFMNHSDTPLESIAPGDYVTAHIDFAGVHEGVDAAKYRDLTKLGRLTGVFDPDKVGIFLSHHFCTAHSDELAENQKKSREWARSLGLRVYDFGSGVAHVVVIEEGLAYPGALCVFGDSHSTAYGAVGAVSTECGMEMIQVLLTGKLWFRVPPTHKYVLQGETPKGVYPRDVIQHVVGQVKMDASVYAAIEWDGSYIHRLPLPMRLPFSLMSVELGAKCSYIEPDAITLEYLKGRVRRPFEVVKSDPGARFEKTYEFDVSHLEPQVATPSSPGNTTPLSDVLGERIDQVCIGTCSGGSIYDFREAARVLEGRKVKARTLIVPSTREVLRQCAAEGLTQIFADSGCDMFPAFCGTCQTMSIGHIAPGEVQMHPGPRNWPGRTAEGSLTYLASPATCAATAVRGRITDPREFIS